MDQAPPKCVGLYANPDKEGGPEALASLVHGFSDAGIKVVVEAGSASLLDASSVARLGENSRASTTELVERCDFIVVLGGDGTMLGAVRAMGANPKPIAGINTGQLGFLTAATADGVGDFVSAVASGKYSVSPRALIAAHRVSPNGETKTLVGLNEVVVTRGAVSRIIKLEAYVDGVFLNHFHADGLIVSTPTGSTAYSLSAGGPIISPDSEVFVITPICPHALANRSIVVNDGAKVEIRRGEKAEEVLMTVDGQEQLSIATGDKIRIARAAYDVPLVSSAGHGFYTVLQQKLHWHGSAV